MKGSSQFQALNFFKRATLSCCLMVRWLCLEKKSLFLVQLLYSIESESKVKLFSGKESKINPSFRNACDARLFFLGGIFPSCAGGAVSSVLLGDSTLEKVPLSSPAL